VKRPFPVERARERDRALEIQEIEGEKTRGMQALERALFLRAHDHFDAEPSGGVEKIARAVGGGGKKEQDSFLAVHELQVSTPLPAPLQCFENPGLWREALALKNCAPFAGLQFFGQVDIDRRMARMTVSLKDIEGTTLFEQKLAPSRGRQDE
jgi:hypothetical protein